MHPDLTTRTLFLISTPSKLAPKLGYKLGHKFGRKLRYSRSVSSHRFHNSVPNWAPHSVLNLVPTLVRSYATNSAKTSVINDSPHIPSHLTAPFTVAQTLRIDFWRTMCMDSVSSRRKRFALMLLIASQRISRHTFFLIRSSRESLSSYRLR